jgi:hypothetical protein
MEVNRIELIDSPATRERVRLVGHVRYDGDAAREEIWFEFPRKFADDLSCTGNAWLAAMIPLAVTLNEALRINAPVDAQLLDGVRELNNIWRGWYPHLPVVSIEADTTQAAVLRPTRTAAFLSGGLDSFFTVLRPRDSQTARPQDRKTASHKHGTEIDDLLTIWGFNVPIEHEEAGRTLFERQSEVARALGKEFVGIATNLRATRWRKADWELIAHGPGLAASALALETRYHTVLIAATGGYRDLHYWASHPVTDPLLSTSSTTLRHDGAAFTRVEKTRLVIDSDVALRALHVCWRSASAENCGACNKCYRTMLILELLGALERCSTFPERKVDLNRAARIYCARPWDFRELQDIYRLALSVGRVDVANAVQAAMRRSRRLTRKLEGVRFFRRFDRAWRLSRATEQYLLRNWIV